MQPANTICGPEGMVQRIAAYVETARGQSVQGPAREAVIRCLLDLLGAAAAGIVEPVAVAVRDMALSTMAAGAYPLWFTGQSSSVIGAAWANSAAASALDLDDGHRLARGHPGAAVIPTALAVARETGASLEDLLSAIVIGYEVGVTIGAARLDYGNTGTWSSYATVATAAALRRTPKSILTHALAIAGESAPNQLFLSAPSQIPAPEGSDVKEGIPWSVVTGLVALGLAERGHTGPRNVLDSDRHYRFPTDLSLGFVPQICNTYFKLYACCRHIHAPLDATLALVNQYSLAAEAIDAIDVETYSGAMRITNQPDPGNLIDVQYSIPYCLALVITAGPQALLPLTAQALGHPEVTALARKVTLSLDPALDARFPAETLARVTITSRGQLFVSALTAPDGEATHPLPWPALETKFCIATRLVATDMQQRRVLNAFHDIRAGNLNSLMAGLSELMFNPTAGS